ncbi:NlpC/P60 family protein [Ignavigranum ruoffiae]|uniref:C40 family peptidase n=1 Tax=Ignavigranum ruoffiae TaxID=89093 RepID=UPI00206F05D0|nr:C40 family peptidase [Ignavigranum ruoffiae]UPQ86252.1 NlpC/P60 family protein [Ignavigranum ruoffiae]
MKKSFVNNVFKSLFASAIAVSSFASPVMAQDYDQLIYGADLEIEGLSQQQAQLYAELAAAYAEANELNEKANALLQELSQDDKEITELQGQIKELEVVITKRQDLLAEQARAVQVTGGSANYLNYVASSKDVSDFVGRVDVVRKMVDANKDLLDVQIADKEAVENKQTQVETAKEEKVVKMIDLESLKASLEETMANQEAVYNQLTNDISLAQANRQALVEEKAAFEEAQAIAAQQAALAAAQAQAEAEAMAAAQAQAEAEAQAQAAAQAEAEAQAQLEQVSNGQESVEIVETEVVTESQAPVENTEVQAEETEVVTEVSSETAQVEETSQADTVIAGPAGDITIDQTAQEEADRVAAEQAAQAEADRVAAEQAAAQAEAERVAAEQAAQAEAERVAAEQAAAQAEADRVAAEQAAQAAQTASGDLLSNAAKYLGTPYVWGGKSPSGFDCSGFVQYVYKETYGKDIGGWTGAQEYSGTRISVAEAQPGDLYFWGNPGSTYHVAIATGNGNYIHASQPGTPLEYNSTQWFTPQFAIRVR